MTVTIEVINQGSLNLLRNMESLGLIHLTHPVSHNFEKVELQEKHANRWLRGCCKNLPKGSVDDFLANCRADKEREFAIEKRQQEERVRYE